MTAELSPNFCPYKGLQPYTEEDRDYFFGRERDQEIIASNLFAASLTVLYGASGVGKSSALRAGVAPLLEQTPRVAVVVFRDWHDKDVAHALKSAVASAVSRTAKKEISVDSSHHFDEFLSEFTRALRGTIFLILDQFEEYFLYHSGSSSMEFDAELAQAINRTDIDANFLLAVREDGLSKLDRFRGRIPNLLTNRLRLEHLDREAAINAIRKPLEQYNRRLLPGHSPVTIEGELVDVLLEEVKTGKVTIQQAGEGQLGDQDASEVKIETPFLQMVLTRLWEEETHAGSRTLRLSTLTQLGGVERIVRTHLDSVMEKLSPSEREAAALLFRFLVTPTGTKIAFSSRDLVSFAELPEATVEPALALLSSPDVRILRPVAPPPDRPAELRYEIFHDVLASAVLDWRARFVSDQQRVEEERRRAEETERQRRELTKARAEAEAERQRAKEQERAASRFFSLAWVAGVIAVLAVGAFFYARSQQKKAETERRLSLAHWLAVAALASSDAKSEIAFAERAVSISKSAEGTVLPDAEQALRRAVPAASTTLDLPGHSSPIASVAFSPDGSVESLGMMDGIRIWDASSGDQLHHFPMKNPEPCALGILFSRDGKKLACANLSRATVWDGETGREAAVNPCETGPYLIKGFALSSDGELLALVFRCGHETLSKVGLWRTYPVQKVQEFPGQAAIFSPQKQRLATIDDKTVNIWDTTANKIVVSIPHNHTIDDLAFNLDGTRLATAGVVGASIWDASSGAWKFKTLFPTQHGKKVVRIALSTDGTQLDGASEDSQIKISDLFSGRVRTLSGSISPISRMFFSRDGHKLLIEGRDGVQIWDPDSGHWDPRSPLLTDSIVAFSPDGKRLAIASSSTGSQTSPAQNKSVTVMDDLTGRPLVRFARVPLLAAAFSPDRKSLVTLDTADNAGVYATSGQALFKLKGQNGEITRVAYSPVGLVIATASSGGSAQLWDATSGRVLRPPPGHGVPVHGEPVTGLVAGLGFSPNGTLVATAGSFGVRLWDVVSGNEVVLPSPIRESVSSVAFSLHGKRLATGGRGVSFWDTASGKKLAGMSGDEGSHSFASVAFSPVAERLAALTTGKVQFWDCSIPEKPRLSATVGASIYYSRGAVFSPDGNWLAFVGWTTFSDANGTMRLWNIPSSSEPFSLLGQATPVAIAFRQDGSRIYALADTGTLDTHYAGIDDLIAEGRRQYTGPLSTEDCDTFHLQATEPCQAASLVDEARLQASRDHVEEALVDFQKAKQLDPLADLDPNVEVAKSLIYTGNQLAIKGNVPSAVATFQEAIKLDPTLKLLDLQTRASQLASRHFVQTGQGMASKGDVAGAAAQFEVATKLDPTLGLDPQTTAKQLAIQSWVSSGMELL